MSDIVNPRSPGGRFYYLGKKHQFVLILRKVKKKFLGEMLGFPYGLLRSPCRLMFGRLLIFSTEPAH
jgi:hypothetical protein